MADVAERLEILREPDKLYKHKSGWRTSKRKELAGIRAEQLTRAIEAITVRIEDPALDIETFDSLSISLSELHHILRNVQDRHINGKAERPKKKKKYRSKGLMDLVK